MTRVLVVEDNADLAFGLRNNLEIEGYEVIVADDGPTGLTRAREEMPDLVILDLMLPGMDGYRVLRALRAEGFERPVLILTARGEEADKVIRFRNGADDYVTKPFGVLELVARVEAVLRRAAPSTGVKGQAADASRFGDIEIQPVARVVRRNGRPVELSPKEYELLLALVQRPGQVVSRAELLKTVWGYHASVVSRTIDTHIAELRRKLEPNPASPRHITTVWKTGYRFLP
jgi:two-component system, OmpR family, alkaline phosphatase synthesis response regulator PhoP